MQDKECIAGRRREIDQVADVHAGEATAGVAKPDQRFERKFFVVPKNVGFAYALLRQICLPDREYPQGQINTLYFDTTDLEQYTKSESGDFKKDKVRIRWYGEVSPEQEVITAFLELKSREGFLSSKQRLRMEVPAERLDRARLRSGIVERRVLLNTVASFGYYPELPLRPIILVSYRRYRFTEMLTGVRVSLDYGIRSTMVARELGYGERELRLPGAVIEVKGPTVELPRTLRRMRLLDTDWSRFSKYGYCVDSHLADPGSVGRLWPSGRMPEFL